MKKIKSFTIDHTKLEKGIYISRIDNNICTYDLRMVKPNTPPYLENSGLHTFEHLFATFVRNSKFSKNIVYFGPMGCRTGFYFLTFDMNHSDVLQLINDTLKYICDFEGKIPGATEKECGNYLDHNLSLAKKYSTDFLSIVIKWEENELYYPNYIE